MESSAIANTRVGFENCDSRHFMCLSRQISKNSHVVYSFYIHIHPYLSILYIIQLFGQAIFR
jgi:hypothetical protein